jgi:hypothetical protein
MKSNESKNAKELRRSMVPPKKSQPATFTRASERFFAGYDEVS